MTPEETFLAIIIGLVIGYFGRYFQYEWDKKSLRDKKYLEGKIPSYLDLYRWIFKVNIYSGLYFQYLKGL